MSTAQADEHRKHIQSYLNVFYALLVLTVITVAASQVHFGSHSVNIAIALLIATFKASLVAMFFMHLKSERLLLYSILLLCLVFFAALLILPVATASDAAGVQIQTGPPAITHHGESISHESGGAAIEKDGH